MLFFWREVKRKKPKRTDYVLVVDNSEKVRLVIYDKATDKFLFAVGGKEIVPAWWAYVPTAPTNMRKIIGNVFRLGRDK